MTIQERMDIVGSAVADGEDSREAVEAAFAGLVYALSRYGSATLVQRLQAHLETCVLQGALRRPTWALLTQELVELQAEKGEQCPQN